MNKTLIALVLAAALPVSAYAAMEGHGRHERGDRFERMAEMLNLDDSQKDLIAKMLEEHKAERKAMREQMRARMDEILTPEQRARRDELREHRGERSKEQGARHERHDCDNATSS